MKAKCRECRTIYEKENSSAEFGGYCSQKCLDARAHKLGWSRVEFDRVASTLGVVEAFEVCKYSFLHRRGEIGTREIA